MADAFNDRRKEAGRTLSGQAGNSGGAESERAARPVPLPGGRLTQLHLPGGAYPTIIRGAGAHIWDTAGREYIDCVLGSGPLILGHSAPAVVNAVKTQVELGSTFYALNDKIVDLASVIVDAAPCAEEIQFCTSGSEATFYAMRIARAATRRVNVLKFEGGFIGGNDYALTSFVPPLSTPVGLSRSSSAGIPKQVSDTVLVAPFNDFGYVTEIVRANADSLAAIVVEPVQRVIEPATGFLEHLRALADEVGALLIFDEVVSGFRWCWGGAQEYYSVTPDLATYGKVIGGGYPLAAVAGRREYMEYAAWSPAEQDTRAYMSGTLNGNPVAAVAGLATLAELRHPEAYVRLNTLGARLREGLSKLLVDHHVPAQALGVGPTFQVVYTAAKVVDYRTMFAEDRELKEAISTEAFRRGIFVRDEKMYLSLAHTDEDISAILEAYRSAIKAVVG